MASARDIVLELYRRAGEPLCCDPRDLLSRACGLKSLPSRGDRTYVDGARVRYPMLAPAQERNVALYRVLRDEVCRERRLVDHGDRILSELILPEPIAVVASYDELAALQPYAPLAIVQRIYVLHHSAALLFG